MSLLPPDDHRPWEARAVGHVMGGLDPDESSAFRQHLLGCGLCKAHVRELRDLAGSLTQAARHERTRQAALRVAEAPRGDRESEVGPKPVTLTGRSVVVLAAALALVGLLVWSNVSLRSRVVAAETLASTVTGLGDGLVVADVTRVGGVSGQVVVNETTVAWSFTWLPAPTDEFLTVVWIVGPDGQAEVVPERLVARPRSDMLAGAVANMELRRLVVTLTPRGDLVNGPIPQDAIPGQVKVDADLTSFTPVDAPDGVGDEAGPADAITDAGAAAVGG